MTKSNKVSRRTFLKIGAGAAGAVLTGCQYPPRWVHLTPYVRPPEEQLAGNATWYASTCRQCPAGCGIIVRIMNGRALKIEGNPDHPLNKGKLCPRGQAGLQVLYDPDRLPGAMVHTKRGSRGLREVAWDEGLNTLLEKLQAAGGRVAMWLGSTTSGHLLDVAQRFTGAIGAPPPLVYDLYGQISGQAVYREANQTLFGDASLPAYALTEADVVLSFGADFLGLWLSQVRYGVEYGAFRSQPLGTRGYLIQIEPRMSLTGVKADRWVTIRPGTEGLIAQAIARIIADTSLGTPEQIAQANALVANVDVDGVAAAAGIETDTLRQLAAIFAEAKRPVAIPGNTMTAQVGNVDAVNAVQILNVIAGAGATGFSLSPASPYSVLEKVETATFADAAAFVKQLRSGAVDVLLVHGANPVFSLAGALDLEAALAAVPYVVSFSPTFDETAAQADLILPDTTYLESWGYDVVAPAFDLPIVGSQQPVVMPVYDGRATADVLLTIARGIPAAAAVLPWTDEVAMLKEMITALPPGANGGSTSGELWARYLQHGGWWPEAASPPAQPTPVITAPVSAPTPQYTGDEAEYPLFLHLYMSLLLSDGRGANQTWLQGSPDPMTTISWETWVEINPTTADELGVTDGDIVRVTSPNGEIVAPVYRFAGIRRDTVAIPIGQGHTDYGRYARGRGTAALTLVGQDATNGELAWPTTRVKITPTGQFLTLATFENILGVTKGFINEEFPG